MDYFVDEGDSTYQQLLNATLRFIAIRPRSEKETRDFLTRTLKRKKTYAPIPMERVIERMREMSYIDDRKFALWLVEQRTGRKPRGQRLIEAELYKFGISKELAQEVIDSTLSQQERGISPRETQLTLAKRAVAKKVQLWKNLPLNTQKQRIFSFLMRRGFDSDTTRGIIDEILEKGYNNEA